MSFPTVGDNALNFFNTNSSNILLDVGINELSTRGQDMIQTSVLPSPFILDWKVRFLARWYKTLL
jgi:hypothetical protein